MLKAIGASFLLFAALTAAVPREKRQAAQSCTCVPYYLCNEGDVLTSGEGLLDVRMNPGTAQTPPPDIAAKGNPCNTFEVCCNAPKDDSLVTPPPPPHVSQCGVRNKDGLNTRVLNPFLGKDEAKLGEFPWQAAILRKEGQANVFVCGATLIQKRVVVTAAHCVDTIKDPTILKVRLGEYDTQSTGEFYPHQDVDVNQVIIHPEFYKGALYNDIAVIFLVEDAKIAPNIDLACLPLPGQEFINQRCTITGWGKSAFGAKGEYSSKLKVVDVPSVPNDQCQIYLRKTRLGKFFNLHPSFMCAGGEEGQDACKGDGGGPLVCEDKGKSTLAGIVAWGIGCGQKDVPGVYVKVSKFVPWISDVTKKI